MCVQKERLTDRSMSMDKFFPELLTMEEASEILKVTPHQIKKLMTENKIAFIHIGVRTKRISKEALIQFINKSTVEPPQKIDPIHRVSLKSKITLNSGRSLKNR